ncbi:hypothetical protein CQW23_00868 [Capsicum baccatum]|uniref:Uncharacterized protein n=1 Tax=Capsicum baccatum TaxID=33114 RepID=A0A2G2XLY7_CAPBA|nr:hypothetical protein CQW23_00868 [Capsicum baccatum]
MESVAIYLFASLLFILVILKIRSNSSSSKLPPGPWKLPIIGNLHQLAAGGPIISYDSVNIGFAPYGNYWKRMHKICVLDLLSTKRVQSFRSLREEEFSGLARLLASHAGSPVNLTQMVHTTMLGFTSRAAFGKKSKLEKLHHEVDRLLDEIIDDHTDVNNNTSMHEDLVDVLLRVQNDGNYELTRNNIKAVILDVFAAGTDTSASTVDWTMAEMLKNPSALEKAQEEVRRVFSEKGYGDESIFDQLKYLRAVIEETLRLHPPAPFLLPRLSRENCKIDGYEIPEKTQVLVNVWTIGRDSRYWEDAECFKPERFLDSSIDFNGNNFEYIPFGAGRRMCPGMSFGLANVEHPLALFLYHFDWKLPNRIKHEDLDMSEVYFGVTVRRELNMHVIPIVSKPV